MAVSRSFNMVNVGEKRPTRRLAMARGTISVGVEAFALLRDRKLPKGDALLLAEVAGIQGAKRASDTIPLCHPLPLDQVKIAHELDENVHSITVYCLAAAFAKTGVEMEAMAGVQAALLAIYDLTKMVNAALTIGDCYLLAKTGGKSGVWVCPQGAPEWVRQEMGITSISPPKLANCRALVVTLSDRAASGVYEDKSGAVLRSLLEEAGSEVDKTVVLPDDKSRIVSEITAALKGEDKPSLIITTGGTGVSDRDVTPEALREIGGKEIVGVGELLRLHGSQYTPNSWSSRSLAIEANGVLIVALPGNVKAVREGMECLLPIIPHLLNTIAGKKHD